MQITTPLSQSKTAAMARVLDIVPRGYTRYVAGTIPREKLALLVLKLHRKYGICATPAQRTTRKAKGFANALLVLYCRPDGSNVEWLMAATAGNGLDGEAMQDVCTKRLLWLGYELVRHATNGRTAWTWKRDKSVQAEFFAALDSSLRKGQARVAGELLQIAANQPGFHGVREQNKMLFAHALSNGYTAPLPMLFYVQKLKHGVPLRIEVDSSTVT
ncbi:MAG: hypothetical protein AB7U71_14700 [Comamonas sp.]